MAHWRLHGLILAALGLAPISAASQGQPTYFNTPATLRLVGVVAAGSRVPLVVVLPATGTSAADMYTAFSPSIGMENYVAMLPVGTPTRAEYADFDTFVAAYDHRVMQDIAAAEGQFAVDPDRIYVAGFSLGGDLAWALVARHPDRFRGGLVMSSGCSVPMSATSAAILHRHDARIVFAVGSDDPRWAGLDRAYHLASARGVNSYELGYPGVHQLPDSANVTRALFRRLFAS